ncbi:MIP/aquaporin family protein [Silvimonas amylolytica]|uniref:Aquaporin n=1 Tax=Silvimonas amylolytica TaxID=449663 RepID=A0ABQ2PI33_9NEIS|nr:MIP/aquaporin family protein [Silvimonas amylolytica]GGP24991.1 aquaporin [Silvimonas amylolytica]
MIFSRKQEFVAELLGTFVLIFLGSGTNCMVTLFSSQVGTLVNGGYTNSVIGWGLSVMFGVVMSIRISGAHLNPAVSLALAVTGRFSWRKLPHYVAGQFIGAFLGAALAFVVYYAKWHQYDPGLAYTANILTTFPAITTSLWPGLIDQVVGTALLVAVLFGLADLLPPKQVMWLMPGAVCLLIIVIGIGLGGMHGYAINPARDLGPRILVWLVGFQHTGFAEGVWLVPVVGPLIGGCLGGILYDRLIGRALQQASAQTVLSEERGSS